MPENEKYMREAIELSIRNVRSGAGGPFGAVVVKDGKIIARGVNTVTRDNDPSAHAEVNAIREACRVLKTFQLDGCELYTSCEPCPMCLGAIYWARPERVFYANTKKDAAEIGFDDDFIYQEIARPMQERKLKFIQLSGTEGMKAFEEWKSKTDKISY
jgi:guanine deaminase